MTRVRDPYAPRTRGQRVAVMILPVAVVLIGYALMRGLIGVAVIVAHMLAAAS